ncbi:ABC transporter permease, partial [bacterium]
QGRAFGARKFEAVLGAEAARDLNLRLADPALTPQQNLKNGAAIQVTHGMPGPNDTPDVHNPIWNVVGILEPTGTANDKVVFVPFISTYAISEHEDGMIEQSLMRARLDVTKLPVGQRAAALREVGLDPEKMSDELRAKLGLGGAARPAPTSGELMQGDAPATTADAHDDHDDHDDHGDDHAGHDHSHDEDAFTLDANGDITPNLPQDRWALSAIFVKVRGGAFGGFNTTMLNYNFKVIDDRATAVSPAAVMREFFNTFLKGSANVLLAISVLVTVVAGASIATTIYNSVAGRLREIAILRALGATRGKILALICAEAGLIGLVGALLGLLLGHAMSGVASGYFRRTLGEDINWLKV